MQPKKRGSEDTQVEGLKRGKTSPAPATASQAKQGVASAGRVQEDEGLTDFVDLCNSSDEEDEEVEEGPRDDVSASQGVGAGAGTAFVSQTRHVDQPTQVSLCR
jgi:hypothetical protein